MTAFSNEKINFLKLLPGELKQFEIDHAKNTKLFFKIPVDGEIYKADLAIFKIVGLTELKDYRSSIMLERYDNINEAPTVLSYGSDYTITFVEDVITLVLGNTNQGLYAIKFAGELKNKDFEIVLRLSFNNLRVLDSFSTQQVRIPSGGSVDYQIPVTTSGVWDFNGYSCSGPLKMYFNTKEPEFNDQNFMADVEEYGGEIEYSTYVESKKSQAIYLQITNDSGKSIDLMFNSKLGGLFKSDNFSSLNINDQVQYDDLFISGIDLTKEKVFVDLGFPLISPNIGKHYPDADYLRFSYEFYQISNDNGMEMDDPNEAEDDEGRTFQEMCKLIDDVNVDTAYTNSYKPIAQNPLFVSNIIYKKQKPAGRVLGGIESDIKFVPDYILTKDVQSVQSKFSMPWFGGLEKPHTEYFITNYMDLKRLKVDGYAQMTGDLLSKYKKEHMFSNQYDDKMNLRFLVYRKLEVLEDPQGNFKYGSFILRPKTIEVNLADTDLVSPTSTTDPTDPPVDSGNPTVPIREKTDDEKPKEYNNLNTDEEKNIITKEINKKNNGEDTYNVNKIWEELLVQIGWLVFILLLGCLIFKIVQKKRHFDRNGYHGSLTGEFEMEGVKMMNETARSIEVTDFEKREEYFKNERAIDQQLAKSSEKEIEMQAYTENSDPEEEKQHEFSGDIESGRGSDEETNEGYEIE